MGKCKYCGLSAGLFSHVHKECEEKHKQGIATLLACLNSYFNGAEDMSCVLSQIKTLQTNNFLSQEDIETCCSQAIKHYADVVKLPITKQHLQIVDSFLNNIGIPRTALNKTGALAVLGRRFYQATLMSYFAENEPMAKVEKRTQIVTRLLPISSDQKESAGLKALDKAAHKYLSNGLITDSEQAHLDDFSKALQRKHPMQAVLKRLQ